MVHIFRKHQQTLMIIITVLVIVSFVWLYNGTKMDRLGSDRVAKIYGQTVAQGEIDRNVHRWELCRDLQLFELLQSLQAMPYQMSDMNRAVDNFVWNGMVMKHEAERLQIYP